MSEDYPDVDDVTECDGCPLYNRAHDESTCNHPRAPYYNTIEYADTPRPAWCPLNTHAVLVRLKP